MNFLKKMLGGNPGSKNKDYYIFNVKCKRCGEVIEGRVDVDNDLSVEYGDNGDSYYCRKVLMGDGKNLCYQQIEITLRFDNKRNLLERSLKPGGDFVG